MPAAARGLPRRAYIGTYSALLKSNVQGRWKSFAASVPSGSYKPQKGQRKSKEERRAMIEAFVNKYKASNAGKFPAVSHIRQEIGGSYYVVREIIQELEYSHKMSLSNKVEVGQLGKAEKVADPRSAAKGHFLSNEEKILTSGAAAKVRSNMKSIDQIMKPSVEESVSPVVMVVDPSSEKVVDVSVHPRDSSALIDKEVHGKDIPFRVAKERLQDGSRVLNRDQKSNASTSSVASEQEVVNSSKPSDKDVCSDESSVSLKLGIEVDVSTSASGQIEGNMTNISTTKLSRDMDSIKGVEQMGYHDAPKTEELHNGGPRSSEHGETSPRKASFWDNLKSLTDGIINFWKKM